MRASKIADVALVDTGVAISTYMTADPVEKTTKVSQICLPSGEQIDKIVIATIPEKTEEDDDEENKGQGGEGGQGGTI